LRAGGGRAKGNSFENKVAKLIRKAFAEFGMDETDAYRTPSSGGHRFAKKEDPGDLVISARLLKLFPHHVECKHYRRVELWPLFFRESKHLKAWHYKVWLKQTCDASSKQEGRHPLLVFKANGNAPIMAVYPAKSLKAAVRLRHLPIWFCGRAWYVATLQDFLARRVEVARLTIAQEKKGKK
jgi:hypothetical protein